MLQSAAQLEQARSNKGGVHARLIVNNQHRSGDTPSRADPRQRKRFDDPSSP
jgi:hypothetical protein